MIEIPVSPGELLDKITILEIKLAEFAAGAKRDNVLKELRLLQSRVPSAAGSAEIAALTDALRGVNKALWNIEDDIRLCEARQDFGPDFIRLARAVYVTNDQRADLKRQINLALASDIIEEKSYAPYQA